MKRISFLLFSLCCMTVATLAQANNRALTETNTYVASIDRYMKTSKQIRYFGDVSNDENDNWKVYRTKKLLDDADEVYEKALVWTRTGKVVAATLTLSSPSGDWAHFVTYYFRTDGSLAKIHAELNTFYGDVSIIRDRFYDASGAQIHATQKILDLQTRKPKKPAGEFMDQEVLVYKNVSALPFSKLL